MLLGAFIALGDTPLLCGGVIHLQQNYTLFYLFDKSGIRFHIIKQGFTKQDFRGIAHSIFIDIAAL